jgi:hypothetical protein
MRRNVGRSGVPNVKESATKPATEAGVRGRHKLLLLLLLLLLFQLFLLDRTRLPK